MGLIASPRHTRRDLEHWAQVSACDVEIGALAERKASSAIESIRRFVDAHRGGLYLGVSWGKDSVVVAHLALRAGVDVPWVWVRHQADNPDCVLVRDAFGPPSSYVEIDASGEDEPGADAVVSAHRRGFAIAAERFGSCYISGVRGDESRTRSARMKRWGVATGSTLAPIGWWSGLDVFGYLALHDMPVHPAYACTFGGALDRERVRVAGIGGERGTGAGRAEWERFYYPRR